MQLLVCENFPSWTLLMQSQRSFIYFWYWFIFLNVDWHNVMQHIQSHCLNKFKIFNISDRVIYLCFWASVLHIPQKASLWKNISCIQWCNRDKKRQYWVFICIVSEFEYPKIPDLCCLTFLKQYTHIVLGKWDKYSVLSQMTDPTKNVFDTQDIWPHWRKKNKDNFLFHS
jgi:hypothetical protein